jgi:hypothetical protein
VAPIVSYSLITVAARRLLLDALDALEAHLPGTAFWRHSVDPPLRSRWSSGDARSSSLSFAAASHSPIPQLRYSGELAGSSA